MQVRASFETCTDLHPIWPLTYSDLHRLARTCIVFEWKGCRWAMRLPAVCQTSASCYLAPLPPKLDLRTCATLLTERLQNEFSQWSPLSQLANFAGVQLSAGTPPWSVWITTQSLFHPFQASISIFTGFGFFIAGVLNCLQVCLLFVYIFHIRVTVREGDPLPIWKIGCSSSIFLF